MALMTSSLTCISGVFVYSYQGQFTLGLAYTGVSKYSWQTVGNVIALVTGIIAVRGLSLARQLELVLMPCRPDYMAISA
jgi:hypothetical protein